MQELRFEDYYTSILEQITPEEFDRLQKLLGIVCNFTERSFGRLLIPRAAMAQSLQVARHVQILFDGRKARVLEVGCGSGYLTAFLNLMGHSVCATDITQAMYLYQNRLWNWVVAGSGNGGSGSGGKVHELALASHAGASMEPPPPGHIMHIPWWRFAQLRPETMAALDVVTCNHALCEMHDLSLRFLLLLSRAALRHDGQVAKFFLFEGWGASSLPDRARAMQRFYEAGFRLVHHDIKIAVFVPDDSPFAASALPLPLNETGFTPLKWVHPESQVTQVIMNGRDKLRPTQYVGIEQLQTLFTALLQTDDHLSEDEKFLKLLGFTEHKVDPPYLT